MKYIALFDKYYAVMIDGFELKASSSVNNWQVLSFLDLNLINSV